MKLLLVSNIFPPSFIGGYELAAQDVAAALCRRGHAVTVLTSPALDGAPDGPTPYPVARTLSCLPLGLEPLDPAELRVRGLYANLANLDALRAALNAERPDAVLCFNLVGLGVLALLRFLGATGIPTTCFLMDNWFAGTADLGDAFARFRRCLGMGDPFDGARVVTCSRTITRELEAEIAAPIPGPVVIPAWVELSALPPPRPPPPAGPVRFVFSSRIAPHKGVGLVLRAAALLRERGVDGFAVDLFGAGSVADTLRQATVLGVDDLVRFRGSLSKAQMLHRYPEYDALLFPTWEREPSGFVVSEAAASGCIPIMTGTMGASEYMLDEQDCLKIRPEAPDLAAAMLRLIDMDPAERAAFRARTRRAGRRVFDAEACFDTLEATIAAVPARPGASPDRCFLALATLVHFWRSSLA